jgi:hypothetical protein
MPKPKSEDAAGAAAIRRRWITLGEVLAVAAVVISGLTFWNSYQERSSAEAERVAEKKEKSAKAQILMLKASGEGSKLDLATLDSNQAVQAQTILFPSALEMKPVETVDPRIEAGWIEAAAKKAKKAGGGGDKPSGDRRLPVAITTRFVSGGETYTDTAIYDVGYRLESGLLDTDAELLGLSLVERVRGDRLQTRLDSIWKSRQR